MAESTIKSGRRKPFVVLYREVAQDGRLSLEARGLFAVMASLPEDWSYTVSGLAKVSGCSKYKLRLLLTEMEDVGYLIRQQSHGGGGKFGGNVYVLQDEAPNRCPQTRTTVDAKKTPLSENAVNGKNRQREMPSTAESNTTKDLFAGNNYSNPPLPPTGKARGRRIKTEADHLPELFERFWRAYPRHDSRQAAIKAWDKLKPDQQLLHQIAQGLNRAKASELWQRGIGVPYASTWLNNARWEDEYKPAAPAGAPAAPPATETGWD